VETGGDVLDAMRAQHTPGGHHLYELQAGRLEPGGASKPRDIFVIVLTEQEDELARGRAKA
jgi:hypothetical protein